MLLGDSLVLQGIGTIHAGMKIALIGRYGKTPA